MAVVLCEACGKPVKKYYGPDMVASRSASDPMMDAHCKNEDCRLYGYTVQVPKK